MLDLSNQDLPVANLVSVRLRVGVWGRWQDLGRPCPQYLPLCPQVLPCSGPSPSFPAPPSFGLAPPVFLA